MNAINDGGEKARGCTRYISNYRTLIPSFLFIIFKTAVQREIDRWQALGRTHNNVGADNGLVTHTKYNPFSLTCISRCVVDMAVSWSFNE